MTGIPFLIFFTACIGIMVLAMSRWKVHPFIAILLTALVVGLAAGIPLSDRMEGEARTPGIVTVIGQGFSGIFTSIGIVIILGALIGTVLEKTGAAVKLAEVTIRLVGKRHPVLAMELMGWVVSIPVFCDSGFVVLNPIRRALLKRTGTSSVALTVALSAGLYLSHVFIPPTPGPLASASALGLSENIALVMGMGVLCSIVPLASALLFAAYIGKKVKADDEVNSDEVTETYEQLAASYGKLPSGALSLSPIFVPVLLMAFSSISEFIGINGSVMEFVRFVSTPVMALAVGTLLAVLILFKTGKINQLTPLTEQTLRTVGPILFVTAAGGVLGKVVSASDLVNYVTSHADMLKGMGIFFPFLLAAILKSAMGSSTVAIITTAGILAPLLPALGYETPLETTLAVMAISAGSMTVSHANDSYFWVVTNFGAMSMDKGYKTHTLLTLILGISAMVEIYILSVFV